MITGHTGFIAHIGYPTHTFKSPMVYNPYFAEAGIDMVVVPMACEAVGFPALLKALFALRNINGAIITMPHKVTTMSLVDRTSVTAQIAGSCNAVRKAADGKLEADMFDGVGFVKAVQRNGLTVAGCRALVVGAGGVGSAIAASLAASGTGTLHLFDVDAAAADRLAGRIRSHCPDVTIVTGSKDPADFDLVVNATPLGMNSGDPMPVDVAAIRPGAYVCDVVLTREPTAFLRQAQSRGAHIQVGADMLYEQVPAYLEFFGLPSTTPDNLRRITGETR